MENQDTGFTPEEYITITDEDGVEYELEILTTVEYGGTTYLAVIPADTQDDAEDLEVSLLKTVMEDGEEILCAIEDEQELAAVYQLVMDAMYEDEEEDGN